MDALSLVLNALSVANLPYSEHPSLYQKYPFTFDIEWESYRISSNTRRWYSRVVFPYNWATEAITLAK